MSADGSALPQGSPPDRNPVFVAADKVEDAMEAVQVALNELVNLASRLAESASVPQGSDPAKELAQAILKDFGSVPVGPDHENYTHEDYLVELALQVMGRAGHPDALTVDEKALLEAEAQGYDKGFAVAERIANGRAGPPGEVDMSKFPRCPKCGGTLVQLGQGILVCGHKDCGWSNVERADRPSGGAATP